MSTQVGKVEQIKKYIENTHFQKRNYSMRTSEWKELAQMAASSPIESVILAFTYGQAKGYRAAKAEVKKS